MQEVNYVPIRSSNLSGVAYNEATKTLFVRFKGSGQEWSYEPVKPETVEAMMAADSKGGFFSAYIRSNPNFTARRLDAKPEEPKP